MIALRHLFAAPGGFRVVNGDNNGRQWTRGFGLVTHGDGAHGADTHRFVLLNGYSFPGGRSHSLARFAAYSPNKPGPSTLAEWRAGLGGTLHTGCYEDALGGVGDHTEWTRDALLHAADDDREHPIPGPFTYMHELVQEVALGDFRANQELVQVDPQWLIGIYHYGPAVLLGYVWGRRMSQTQAEEWWAIKNLAAFHRLNPTQSSDTLEARALALVVEGHNKLDAAEAGQAFQRMVDPQEDFAFFHVAIERAQSRLPSPIP